MNKKIEYLVSLALMFGTINLNAEILSKQFSKEKEENIKYYCEYDELEKLKKIQSVDELNIPIEKLKKAISVDKSIGKYFYGSNPKENSDDFDFKDWWSFYNGKIIDKEISYADYDHSKHIDFFDPISIIMNNYWSSANKRLSLEKFRKLLNDSSFWSYLYRTFPRFSIDKKEIFKWREKIYENDKLHLLYQGSFKNDKHELLFLFYINKSAISGLVSMKHYTFIKTLEGWKIFPYLNGLNNIYNSPTSIYCLKERGINGMEPYFGTYYKFDKYIQKLNKDFPFFASKIVPLIQKSRKYLTEDYYLNRLMKREVFKIMYYKKRIKDTDPKYLKIANNKKLAHEYIKKNLGDKSRYFKELKQAKEYNKQMGMIEK